MYLVPTSSQLSPDICLQCTLSNSFLRNISCGISDSHHHKTHPDCIVEYFTLSTTKPPSLPPRSREDDTSDSTFLPYQTSLLLPSQALTSRSNTHPALSKSNPGTEMRLRQ